MREKYPSTSKYARRGIGGNAGGYQLPDETTEEKPGSEAKIAIMAGRAAAGISLFHPEDKQKEPDDVPEEVMPKTCRVRLKKRYVGENWRDDQE